jgi:hypothetical protein
VLPPSREAFEADRTAREVVVLNLFVAIQACLDLAAHWLADEGWDVPQRYGEIFLALADHGVCVLVRAGRPGDVLRGARGQGAVKLSLALSSRRKPR